MVLQLAGLSYFDIFDTKFPILSDPKGAGLITFFVSLGCAIYIILPGVDRYAEPRLKNFLLRKRGTYCA